MRFKPTLKQWEVLEMLMNKNGKNHICFGGASGGGKSFIGSAWLILSCIKYPGSRWIMGRTSLTALKASTLSTFMDLVKSWDLLDHVKVNHQSNTIIFSNGSIILMKDLEYKPSDQNYDSLGSIEVTGIMVDEAAQITEICYNVLSSRIRYKLKEFDIEPKMLMTLNPTKNFLYSLFYKPSLDGTLAPYRAFIQAYYYDNSHLSNDYIESLSRLTPHLKKRLMDGDWDYENTEDQLIDSEQIFNLPTSVWTQTKQYWLTIDPARFGKDRSVGFIWDGFTVIDCIIQEKKDLQTQSNLFKEYILKYKIPNSNIIVDSDGVGSGVCDALRARGIVNNAKAIGGENFQNLKTQLYYKLSESINSVRILEGVWTKRVGEKTLGELLSQELSYVRSETTGDNKLSIMKKDKIKTFIGRSPDFSDCIAYRMLPLLSQPLRVGKRF
jgi:hypothetical protein